METVDLREAKWRYRWNSIKEKCSNGLNWCVQNKELAIPAILGATTVVKGVTKITSKAMYNHAVNKEIAFKERTIYDHSLGRYVELKKPLTNAQALTVEERKAQGEKLHVILNDMGLLKRK